MTTAPPRFNTTRASRRSTFNAVPIVLFGNVLIGVALAVTVAVIVLNRMRPPLEKELAKRALAVCRATAGDLEYAATVGDGAMAHTVLATLANEPTSRVVGAWLSTDGAWLSQWSRSDTLTRPARSPEPQPAVTSTFVERAHGRDVVVNCAVNLIESPGVHAAELGTSRLWLEVDTAEVAGTVKDGFAGALWQLLVVIFVAVFGQLGIALFVIGRLNKSVRELHDTQTRLLRSDKLAAVGTLSAGVAHEINNPLSYLMSNLEFVTRGLSESIKPEELADLREALAEARDGAERVRVIVRDLKALSRGDDEKVSPIDVRVVVESAIGIAANELKHRARVVRQFGEVALVDANDVRLGQVFLNLLINAAHATSQEGSDLRSITVTTRMLGAQVAVSIADQGSGIPAEHLPQLFEPFFTTKEVGAGTGLGLWVCHNIVTALKGEIQVESEVGVGTTVTVVLPASTAVVEEAAPVVRAVVAATKRRVLVVDDEPLVGRSLERLLGDEYVVESCTKSREALARLCAHEEWDVVLCDVMMPELSGPELYRALVERVPVMASRVIFISGALAQDDRIAGSHRPHLDKPFDGEQVKAVIREAVAQLATAA